MTITSQYAPAARVETERKPRSHIFTGQHGQIEYSIERATNGQNNPLVLMVPGWSCEKEDLRELSRELANSGYTSVVLNNPGIGSTELSGVDHNRYMLNAADNAVSMTKHMTRMENNNNIIILGHSMGGQIAGIAYSMLKATPEIKVKAAVLITPAINDPVEVLPAGLLSTITRLGVGLVSRCIDLAGNRITNSIDYLTRGLMVATHALTTIRLIGAPKEAKFENSQFWKHLYSVPMRVITIGMEAMRRAGKEAHTALVGMTRTIPTLVIEARHDKLVNPKIGEKLRADSDYSHSITVIGMNKSGHFPHNERLEETVKIILEHLEQS